MVSDIPPFLIPLTKQIYRRLELRFTAFQDELRAITNRCARDGLATSGAFVKEITLAFRNEVIVRTDVIETVVRAYRQSCSSIELAYALDDLKKLLTHALNQTIQYVRHDCEQALGPMRKQAISASTQCLKLHEHEVQTLTNTCLDLIESIAEEVAMAAKTDLMADSKSGRPGYVFHNTFNAPTGAVSQGAGSTSIYQSTTFVKLDCVEVLRLLRNAYDEWPIDAREKVAGAESLIETELKFSEPDEGLLITALKKVGSVASKVAETVGTQALLSYLKLHGVG